MARRRRTNPRMRLSEAQALHALLNRHGYGRNPGARPNENEIPTVRLKRRRNPGRKKKMFGPGKRWRTKGAMLRYLTKIRRKAMRVLRRKGRGRRSYKARGYKSHKLNKARRRRKSRSRR